MTSPNSELFLAALGIIVGGTIVTLVGIRARFTAKPTPPKLEPEPLSKVEIEQVEPVEIVNPSTAKYSVAKADQQSSLKRAISASKVSVVLDLHSSPRLKRSASRKDPIMMEEVKPLERSQSKSRIIQSLDNL
jgi:hypothetical protein